jgi:mono/diheme cytochrome c family protein
MNRYASVIVGATVVAVVLSLAQRPQRAAALPTFAQAYQIDCSVCHTMVPALNAYGRYVQSTAFAALDARIIKRVAPVVVREAVGYRSIGDLDPHKPNDKYTFANLSVNLVGLASSSFSYRLEQSLYQGDVGGGSTGHFWVSYNRLLHGDGHLIVGALDAPAPPAFSFWHDQSGFGSGEIGVGQHGYLLDGVRWGVGFNYVPQDYEKQPYKVQLAYIGNAPSLYNASVFSNENPYAPNQAGSDRAFQYKAAFARPDEPIEAGVYGAVGSYILSTGYVHPSDAYTATGVYAQRDPVGNVPGFLAFYQQTTDQNVGPGAPTDGIVQRATSKAFAFEIDESLLGGDVMLGVRPVEYLGGLQPSTSGLDTQHTMTPHYGAFDIIARDPQFSPYLYATFESLVGGASSTAFGQPTWQAELKFAGPLFRAPRLTSTPQPAAAQPAVQPDAVSPAAAASDAPAATAVSAEIVQAGKAVFTANCAACHNVDGTGGVGPNLHGEASAKTLAQTVAFIENPSGAMPKLYPATISAKQVDDVAAYVRTAFAKAP